MLGYGVMQSITHFNTLRHHICLNANLVDNQGIVHFFRSILDTGAPSTEFSDRFLKTIGFLKPEDIRRVTIASTQQTKKYGKLVLPKINCLGQVMENVPIKISSFEASWGIDALIGLDFFRRFRVTIDYKFGHLRTEPL